MRIGDTIYLDHQSTTPTDRRVLAEMAPYFDERFGNPHSADHALGWDSAKAVDEAAARVARMVGADADEVVFTSGATEANNLALFGLALGASGGKRRRILVSAIEHKSVLAQARTLHDRLGYEVEIIPVDSNGVVNITTLEEAIDDNVLLVSTMLVNNEIGSIQPIRAIKHLCAAHGALLHCDGAQSPGAIDISDISEWVDLLSLSAHKMYGPKGLGALIVNRLVQGQLEPIIHGGGQQRHLRSGTVPTPLCVGMGVAAEIFASDSAVTGRENLCAIRDRFIEGVRKLGWSIHLNGPPRESRHPGNANIRFDGFSAHDILGALQPRIAASTGSACTSGFPEPSHVLTAIGLSNSDSEASIRFSLGRHTTVEDVDIAVDLIGSVLARLPRTDIDFVA